MLRVCECDHRYYTSRNGIGSISRDHISPHTIARAQSALRREGAKCLAFHCRRRRAREAHRTKKECQTNKQRLFSAKGRTKVTQLVGY